METIRAVRNIRSELNVAPSKPVAMFVRVADEDTAALFNQTKHYLTRFCHLQSLTIGQAVDVPKQAMSAVVTNAEVFLPLADLVDIRVELERLEKEVARLQSEVDRVEKKLGNPQFVQKAPADVVEAERAKAVDYKAKLAAVQERISALRG
jgi:valyl-tRNA synthetase